MNKSKAEETIKHYKLDTASKAGLMSIYATSGQLLKPKDLTHLTEKQREAFLGGFEDYMNNPKHPARADHAPIHYGRFVYYLSIIYYFSLAIWLFGLVNSSILLNNSIDWSLVWFWIIVSSMINLVLTFFGIHLEAMAYKNSHIPTLYRWMAAIAVIVLIIAIISNIVTQFGGSTAIPLAGSI